MELNRRHRKKKEAKLQEILRTLKDKEIELKRRPGKKKIIRSNKEITKSIRQYNQWRAALAIEKKSAAILWRSQ